MLIGNDASGTALQLEAAADAIVSGDLAGLRRLLDAEPGLTRLRSERAHRATLLHYVAANGVEDFRRRTPENVVEIAAALLDAGAEVNATVHVYGADWTTLGLAATSGHPERAGVQEALLSLMLDRGATLDPSLIKACLANGRGKAAEFLAAQMERPGNPVGIAEAAGLGRLDWMARYFAADGSLTDGATDLEMREGFLYACQFGREPTVEFLLGRGTPIQASDARGQTGLHHAVIGGHPGTVKVLLKHNPPLEAVNCYGGTPLGQALWSVAHAGDTMTYLEILEALVAAGAEVPERHIPGNPHVDRWLEQHGCQAEPEWQWFGEETTDGER